MQGGVSLENPQDMPLSNLNKSVEHSKTEDVDEFGLKYSGIPTWRELTGEPHFKVGIVIDSSSTNDRHISAMSRPASMCSLRSLVVLHPQKEENKNESVRNWLDKNRHAECEKNITIGWGQEGFEDLLKSDVDAVYIIVPPG